MKWRRAVTRKKVAACPATCRLCCGSWTSPVRYASLLYTRGGDQNRVVLRCMTFQTGAAFALTTCCLVIGAATIRALLMVLLTDSLHADTVFHPVLPGRPEPCCGCRAHMQAPEEPFHNCAAEAAHSARQVHGGGWRWRGNPASRPPESLSDMPLCTLQRCATLLHNNSIHCHGMYSCL